MTPPSTAAGLVEALRSGPEAQGSTHRQALLDEASALRRKREGLSRQINEIDSKIAHLQRDADAALSPRELSADEEDERLRSAVRSGLRVDLAEVNDRSERLTTALQARARTLARSGNDSDMQRRGAEVDEIERLDRAREEAPTRQVATALADRAAQLRRRLQPFRVEAETEMVALDDQPYEIAVLAAIEPNEGPPTALGLVLPVPTSVHGDWRTHGDDLSTRLTWRVMAALAVALRDAGAADAPIRTDRFDGCLSIQVWLGDCDVNDSLKDALTAGFDRIHTEAGELRKARLDLFLAWVDSSILTAGRAQ